MSETHNTNACSFFSHSFLLIFSLLVFYGVFVVVDTVFHITPDEPYAAALVHFVQGLTGNSP